jgi:hypothetical protein
VTPNLHACSHITNMAWRYFKRVTGCLQIIAHAHLLVQARSERFLLARATFRVGLAGESHWMQPMLVLTIHWWHAPISVGGLYAKPIPTSEVVH